MAKKRKESIILFGEGKTEAIFLNHLKKVTAAHLRVKIKVDKGQGKSPQDIADRLVNKHLKNANYDRSLLLIDSDVAHGITPAFLKKNSISLVQSSPKCLEGLLLQLIGKSPKGAVNSNSKQLKSAFQSVINANDSNYTLKLMESCPKLFPLELIESKRKSIPELNDILNFLGV